MLCLIFNIFTVTMTSNYDSDSNYDKYMYVYSKPKFTKVS